MGNILTLPEQRVVLDNVSWDSMAVWSELKPTRGLRGMAKPH
jgi:hypothetical protein